MNPPIGRRSLRILLTVPHIASSRRPALVVDRGEVGGEGRVLEPAAVEPGVEAAEGGRGRAQRVGSGRGHPFFTTAPSADTRPGSTSSAADDVAACGSVWRTSAPEARRWRGRRAVRPQLAREAWSTGAEVAGAPWQTRRTPPARARSGRGAGRVEGERAPSGRRALVGLESAPMDALGRAGRVERLTIQPRKKTQETITEAEDAQALYLGPGAYDY